ncbi:hypothetical protein SeMB42_g01680 [Synchytrium endobioticum]|nr:hypothetical protein SeMB42_g01680 [Synchytrium endobioticum]
MKSNRKQQLEPPRLNGCYMVEWRGSRHKAKIVEVRGQLPNGDPAEYYVHYIGQDRRLDEWIEPDVIDRQIIPDPSSGLTTASPNNDESEDSSPQPDADDGKKVTRNMKRKFDEMNYGKGEGDRDLVELEREREEATKVRNIETIYFGKYKIETWYFSPYPEEYKDQKILYICEFCLKYMRLSESMMQHRKTCNRRKPPGHLVYQNDPIKVYEVDGKDEKLYCQNLCLLSKLFLDHKTVYYDIESFYFYVLTESEKSKGREQDHIVGYFSKEKQSPDDYNLACILTLPPFQRRGFGRMLIEFSYELSKVDGKVGSPERPLSDLGMVGYRSYWQSVLMSMLRTKQGCTMTLKELSAATSIRVEDIVSTLSSMSMVRYWKGENVICVTPAMVADFLDKHPMRLEPIIDAKKIHSSSILGSHSPSCIHSSLEITNCKSSRNPAFAYEATRHSRRRLKRYTVLMTTLNAPNTFGRPGYDTTGAAVLSMPYHHQQLGRPTPNMINPSPNDYGMAPQFSSMGVGMRPNNSRPSVADVPLPQPLLPTIILPEFDQRQTQKLLDMEYIIPRTQQVGALSQNTVPTGINDLGYTYLTKYPSNSENDARTTLSGCYPTVVATFPTPASIPVPINVPMAQQLAKPTIQYNPVVYVDAATGRYFSSTVGTQLPSAASSQPLASFQAPIVPCSNAVGPPQFIPPQYVNPGSAPAPAVVHPSTINTLSQTYAVADVQPVAEAYTTGVCTPATYASVPHGYNGAIKSWNAANSTLLSGTPAPIYKSEAADMCRGASINSYHGNTTNMSANGTNIPSQILTTSGTEPAIYVYSVSNPYIQLHHSKQSGFPHPASTLVNNTLNLNISNPQSISISTSYNPTSSMGSKASDGGWDHVVNQQPQPQQQQQQFTPPPQAMLSSSSSMQRPLTSGYSSDGALLGMSRGPEMIGSMSDGSITARLPDNYAPMNDNTTMPPAIQHLFAPAGTTHISSRRRDAFMTKPPASPYSSIGRSSPYYDSEDSYGNNKMRYPMGGPLRKRGLLTRSTDSISEEPATGAVAEDLRIRCEMSRKYVCGICQRRFTRPSSLKTHMHSHTGERPYVCTNDGCTKRFSVLSNLRRHCKTCLVKSVAQRQSFNSIPSLCSSSSSGFSTYGSLGSQRSYHSGDKAGERGSGSWSGSDNQPLDSPGYKGSAESTSVSLGNYSSCDNGSSSGGENDMSNSDDSWDATESGDERSF